MTIRRTASAPFGRPATQVDRPPPWYQVGPVVALAQAAAAGDDPEPGDPKPAAGTSADVYVYDTIGGWFGLTADDFVRDVASLDVDQIVLHLNTPGGDASEGVAIANVLRAHRARVVVRVDGMAASAGSVIAMAGDEVVMGIGAQMMVHDAWGYAQGDAAEMAAAQRMLDSTSDALATTYAARAGGTPIEWRAVMRGEAWYTAEEAVTAGLADRVAAADETGTAEGEQVTPGSSLGGWWGLWDSLRSPDRFDLSAYNYAGRDHAPAPPIPAATGGPVQEGSPAVAFTDEQLTTMRQELGLADDADEAAIVDAVTAAAAETPPADPLPEGTVVVDSTQLAELRASAARGVEAHARQEREDRERLVDAAVGDGRIPPARREAWLAALEADPGSADTLAKLAPGLVPVGPAIGSSAAGAPEGDDALYASLFGKES